MTQNELLWYSSFSTGIFEVDNQHGNIDMLVQMLGKIEGPLEEPLNDLIIAITHHFEYEQSLLKGKFPEDHLREHRRFISYVEELSRMLLSKKISVESFIDIVRTDLVEHVQRFDVRIKGLID